MSTLFEWYIQESADTEEDPDAGLYYKSVAGRKTTRLSRREELESRGVIRPRGVVSISPWAKYLLEHLCVLLADEGERISEADIASEAIERFFASCVDEGLIDPNDIPEPISYVDIARGYVREFLERDDFGIPGIEPKHKPDPRIGLPLVPDPEGMASSPLGKATALGTEG